MDDAEFLRCLQTFAGNEEIWGGFNPSSWRSLQPDGGEPEAAESASAKPLSQGGACTSGASVEIAPALLELVADGQACPPGTCKLNRARQFASEEVGFPDRVAELEKVEWKMPALAVGDASAEGAVFVPWRMVENYPNLFVGKANGARAAPLFTLASLHENQVWDLFYLRGSSDTREKPLLFVPVYQFEHLLEVVNAKLETRFTIPPGRNEKLFRMIFGLGGSPRPRFLGRSDSVHAFTQLREAIPAPHPDDDMSKATQDGRDEFNDLVTKSRTHRRRDRRSDRGRSKRIQARKEWGRSIKRVQRYLGLRGGPAGDAKGKASSANDPVIFVAIDIEAWEQNHNLVTEIGVAVLDTALLEDIEPGDGGENWFPLIEAHHFRVKENAWARNWRYVRGCADRFNFGTSKFIKESTITRRLRELIDDAAPRRVVLVFHESTSDLNYMRQLSYAADEAASVVDVVDTREMHQYMVRSNDSASLGNVLRFVGVAPRHLHNAGNDAVYTMQAMVGLAVKKRAMRAERCEAEAAAGPASPSEPTETTGWTSEDTDGE